VPPASLRPPTAQTFEEQEIPAPFRAAVEKELTPNEKLLWVGRPSRNPEMQDRNPLLTWLGGGLLVLAFVIVVADLVSGVAAGFAFGHIFGFVFAVVVGVIGLAFLLPLLVKPGKHCRFCYAVTNRRAMLAEMMPWQKAAAVQSYLPQQLLGLERQDHATVAGAGDLIFEYQFALAGNSFNGQTGGFFQKGPGVGSTHSPQRVPRGFLGIDQARDVEELIRATLLQRLEQTLGASPLDAEKAPESSAPPVSAACACGATIEAAPALAGKSVRCPRCAATVAIARPASEAEAATVPVDCREDGAVPADVKAKALAGLDASEKLAWIGQPVAGLILVRNSGYFVGSAIGMVAALIWLAVVLLVVPAAPAPRPQQGKPAVAAPKSDVPLIAILLPIGLFLGSACASAVPVVRWRYAKRTCYVLTNRRALVYKEGLFGPTRESYSPMEVSAMRRSDSWLTRGSGDLIFRTVQVVSTSRSSTGRFQSSVRTIHYGFLAIPHIDEVEHLVRATLIDRFVDRLTGANAL
jgi:hypothetical protein